MVSSLQIPTFRASIQRKSEEKSDNMSPFAIFAIVLTLAYIIYYGVMISRDLTRKPGQETADEENIEVDNFEQTDKPVKVSSVGDGYQIGDRPAYQPEPVGSVVTLDDDGEVALQGLGNVMTSEMQRRIGASVEEMEDIDVDSQPEVDAETYAKTMESRHGFTIDETEDEQDNTRV